MNNAPTPFEEGILSDDSTESSPRPSLIFIDDLPSIAAQTSLNKILPQQNKSTKEITLTQTPSSSKPQNISNKPLNETTINQQTSTQKSLWYHDYYAIIHRIIAGFVGGAAGMFICNLFFFFHIITLY